jgi:hypothetical protein
MHDFRVGHLRCTSWLAISSMVEGRRRSGDICWNSLTRERIWQILPEYEQWLLMLVIVGRSFPSKIKQVIGP